jgi:hypothetical protein
MIALHLESVPKALQEVVASFEAPNLASKKRFQTDRRIFLKPHDS